MSDKQADAPALQPTDIDFVRKAAKLFIPDYDLVVYGSRARGDNRWDSDLDLAVYGSTQSLDDAIINFESVMEHAPIGPIASVVEMNLVTGLFREHVLRDGVIIHEGRGEFRQLRLAAKLTPPETVLE